MQHPETILHRTALINDDPLHYFITSRDCNEDFVKTLFSIAYHDNENDNPLRKPKPTVAAYPPDKWFELHEQLTLVNSEIGILQRLDTFVKERMATIDQDIRGIDKAKTDLQTELRSQADRDDGTRKSVATVTEITALGEKIQQFANHLAILEECAANLDNADSVLVPLISNSPSLNEQNETLIAIQNYLFALFSRCAELETALDEIELGSAGLVFCDSLTQDERTDTLRAAFLNLGLYNPQVKIDKRIVELRQKFADVTSALDQIRQRKTDIVDEAWGSRQKQLEIYHQFSQLLQQYRKNAFTTEV
jgi:chromosome segregation ATPase